MQPIHLFTCIGNYCIILAITGIGNIAPATQPAHACRFILHKLFRPPKSARSLGRCRAAMHAIQLQQDFHLRLSWQKSANKEKKAPCILPARRDAIQSQYDVPAWSLCEFHYAFLPAASSDRYDRSRNRQCFVRRHADRRWTSNLSPLGFFHSKSRQAQVAHTGGSNRSSCC